MVLALFFFLALTGTLGWAAWKVIRLARKSSHMHKNPGYILYSDPAALNKWGFLYVQYRATAYYFVVPVLAYIFLKAAFIGLAQKSFIAQAIALVLIEAAALVGVSILRPWMDKKTNTFNIAIVVINFINVIFLLIFTEVFNQPVSRAVGSADVAVREPSLLLTDRNRASSPASSASSSSSSTPSSPWSISSSCSSRPSMPSSPRTRTRGTSRCGTTEPPSPSRRRS